MSTQFLRISPLLPARDVEQAIASCQRAFGFDLFVRDAEPAQFAIVGSGDASLNLFAKDHNHLARQTSLRMA